MNREERKAVEETLEAVADAGTSLVGCLDQLLKAGLAIYNTLAFSLVMARTTTWFPLPIGEGRTLTFRQCLGVSLVFACVMNLRGGVGHIKAGKEDRAPRLDRADVISHASLPWVILAITWIFHLVLA